MDGPFSWVRSQELDGFWVTSSEWMGRASPSVRSAPYYIDLYQDPRTRGFYGPQKGVSIKPPQNGGLVGDGQIWSGSGGHTQISWSQVAVYGLLPLAFRSTKHIGTEVA